MSGVVAVISRRAEAFRLGAEALERLRHESTWATLQEDIGGLWAGGCGPNGQVSSAVAPAETGARVAAQRLAVVGGEIMNIIALRAELALPLDASSAIVMLAAYGRWGASLFDHVEGAYVVLVHEELRKLTIAGVDPRGVGHLQALRVGDDVLLASEAKAFLADPRFRPSLDQSALAELLVIGWALDGSSLFTAVEGLPLGCHFEVRDGRLATVRHADDHDLVDDSLRGDAYIERLADDARTLAEEAFRGDGVLFPLTGGLDARLLLAAAPARARPLSFTFGAPRDPDVCGAEALARLRDLPHLTVAFEPDFVARHARETVWLSEGRLNVVNNTTGSMMERFVGSCCFVSGSGGEAGRRELRTNMMMPDRRLLSSTGAEFERSFFARAWRPRFTRAELEAVFGADGDDLYAAALERVTGAVRASDGLPAADRLDLFLSGPAEAINRTRLRLASRWVTARAPFFTRRWLRGLFAGAPEERIDDLLRLRLVRHFDPTLAHVPWTQTRLSLPLSGPILLSLRAVSSGLARLPQTKGAYISDASTFAATRSGAEPFSRISARARGLIYPYGIDLEGWMRAGSRSFVESVLFSEQTRARGLMHPAGVLQMWRQQLAGRNHARAVGALLTLELWCRAFLDGERPGS